MLNSELLHPNWLVSGRANRLKKAVAEVNRLWIQTPEGLPCLCKEVLHVLVRADIALDRQCLCTGRLDLFHSRLEGLTLGVLHIRQDHPLSGRQSVTLQDTLPYPQVCFAPCAGLRKSVDALFCAINAAPIVAMETEEDAVIAGLVAAGFGIAVLPDDPLLQSLSLAVLPLTSPDPSRTAYLSRRRGIRLPDAAERFWIFCREILEQQ